uniref:ubiquitinyl hydrolase 1 n=1 Tax=Ascaris lumbricoides TaxID=6252 RepID=A0A9J2Q9K9_ASCLU
MEQGDGDVSRCTHVTTCQKLTELIVVKAKQDDRCDICSVRDGWSWLCLTDSCMRTLCGSRANAHSDLHFKENESHCLQMNLRTGRIWCHSCICEVYAEANLPPFAPPVQRVLCNKSILRHVSGPLAAAAGINADSSTLLSEPRGIECDDAAGINSDSSTLLSEPRGIECDDGNANVVNGVRSRSMRAQPIQGRLYNEHGDRRRVVMSEIEDDSDTTFPRGLTGLCNLGNTCYLNAAVQALSNCAPLADLFRSSATMAPFSSQLAFSRGSEPPVSRSFRLLLQSIWSPARSGCTSPHLLLTQVRTHCPQFRGWAQQDSQEFIRCFLDLLHRELRQPVFSQVRTHCPQFRGWAQQDSQEFIRCFLDLLHRELRQPVFSWEWRASSGSLRSPVPGMRLSMCSSSSSLSLRPSSALSSTQPILDEMEQVSRRNSFSSTSSGRSSNAAEQYETADSGWSSDGDTNGVDGASSQMRRRVHSDSSGTREGVSLGDSNSPAYASHSSSPFEKRGQPAVDFNENSEKARDGVVRYRSIVSEVFDGELRSAVKCLTCQHVSETHETFQVVSFICFCLFS